MKICFIGAGKVGTSFGLYLSQKGFNVVGYLSRSFESAKKAAHLTNSMAYKNLSSLIGKSDIIFITTNDDSIENVVNQLSQARVLNKGQIVVHMSGSYSSSILSDLEKFGCYVYSMHPLQSFANVENSIKKLENTVFTIEGSIEKMSVLESVLKKTGNEYFKIDSNLKTIYHAGACVISNYLVTLMDFGLSFFSSIGIDENDAFKAVYPLIEGTIENVKNLGCKNALTGPISRGDINTIENHLNSIKVNIPNKLSFYKIMALMTLDLSSKIPSQNKEKIEMLRKILQGVDS
ncbi:Rossmann-like and DUF2520 domain-containing protein [Tepidibacter thalassicus]|uniref:Predicted oxidoreductase, contains short-chain dehydrogenase (SDR) and DUF2520 domains n=1 Tax=Tepidibacter thalassicus DSM 15285 TaxID=1123350 RepID=A0A1M5PLQ6_9FIRM|nr:Rossmann-like and DUF2520 domain-containing protein [Tepidibacter thalassicus]SHH02671.1 Predicted oxidoreductase, contains short-chain dehydrogenase (SDR) and DUF2520 domains [Tepidibacter thalassicus DSM 15285]